MIRYLSYYDRKVPAANTDPLPKDIVCISCECLGKEDKVATKKDGTQVAEKYLVCEWPKVPQLCNASDGSKTRTPKSKGCSNGFSHLKRCVSHGDNNYLASEHESNLSSKQSFIGETFKLQLKFSNKEN